MPIINVSVFIFVKKYATWILALGDTPTIRRPQRYAQERTQYLLHREQARKLVMQKLEQWNAHYGFAYNRVSIRHARTRWGSCSSKRNLNFNYKILFLAESLQDYVIVHELCHLQEMNHGKRFWALVARTIPDYQESRKKLEKNLF